MATNPPLDLNAGFSCPIPISEYPQVLLAHGGGGKLTHHLVKKMFLPQFANDALQSMHDGAVLSVPGGRIAFSTDSYVVKPLFFPGGDIGTLAVNGTVNDLAMCGARPLYLSAGFIIEEGLPMETLWAIVRSMKKAAQDAGVQLVTGDTKVVDRGKGDGIFINTAGIGIVEGPGTIAPQNARPGDAVLLSGPIAMHGVAIMSVREGLEFETEITSDCAALNGLVDAMMRTGAAIHVLRDPTRGGISSALNEIAEEANAGFVIDERQIPIPEEVRGACEILGLDPLYVANEGKLIAIVERADAQRALEAMRAHPLGREAAMIGEVVKDHAGVVVMRTRIGGSRVVDMLSGEQLPRIC
jgi:hydrogenase expression/formation protein HypE